MLKAAGANWVCSASAKTNKVGVELSNTLAAGKPK